MFLKESDGCFVGSEVSAGTAARTSQMEGQSSNVARSNGSFVMHGYTSEQGHDGVIKPKMYCAVAQGEGGAGTDELDF